MQPQLSKTAELVVVGKPEATCRACGGASLEPIVSFGSFGPFDAFESFLVLPPAL